MIKKNLSTKYHPNEVEKKWYKTWEESDAFKPNEENQESYTIMIPPPNVTGILHIGHVLNNSIQDILIRRARMKGKNTLWLPGTDHASIATETKVTQMLEAKGINKKDMDRDEFLKHAWQWKEKYGGTIIKQLKKIGCSCDWDRERFTMDDNYSQSVLECFVRLYNDKLIYRGERMINWDPIGQTALSDEEVIYKETNGKLWHFKYPLSNSPDYIVVATTRPETMLGDTGVAVNPKDERYKHLIGKTVLLPISDREIPIFADNYVDMEFGTGCVKVTPAHDPNDFSMAERHNLEIINIMHPDATMNDKVPPRYRKLTIEKTREIVVSEMKKMKLVQSIEDFTHNVGYSERTNAIVEPYLSKQWFLKMEDMAKNALQVVQKENIKIYPNKWIKTYNHWLENIKDWCISRQLWWGHRIPVWYKNDEIYCGLKPPQGNDWIQDEDVLDTWFSSWLWPFATLGWPNNTKDLKSFYPTNDLVTGPDIIFFWVARMIMGGLYFQKEIPFSNIYFTGIIRDDQGRKMSKSLGNSPDPLDLINQYGADALRVGLLLIAPQGSDILYSKDKIIHGRNFMNKLWNSARFILMNTENFDGKLPGEKTLNITDKWIISKLHTTIDSIEKAYKQYKLNEVIKIIYEFVYHYFCDWYIEFAKTRFYGEQKNEKLIAEAVSIYILKNILKLMHPFTPFITEEIWSYVDKSSKEMLIRTQPTKSDATKINKQIEKEMNLIMQTISSIRNIKASLNVPPGEKVDLFARGPKEQIIIIENNITLLNRMVKVEKLEVGINIEKPKHAATSVVGKLEIFIPLKNLIDPKEEINRLQKQIDDMNGRVNAVQNKLSNKNFIERAPRNIVEHEQGKLMDYKLKLEKLNKNLTSLKQ